MGKTLSPIKSSENPRFWIIIPKKSCAYNPCTSGNTNFFVLVFVSLPFFFVRIGSYFAGLLHSDSSPAMRTLTSDSGPHIFESVPSSHSAAIQLHFKPNSGDLRSSTPSSVDTTLQAKATPRSVRFNPTVIVGYTYASYDYDRTSIQVDPITKADVSQIREMRSEFQRAIKKLYQNRQEKELKNFVNTFHPDGRASCWNPLNPLSRHSPGVVAICGQI